MRYGEVTSKATTPPLRGTPPEEGNLLLRGALPEEVTTPPLRGTPPEEVTTPPLRGTPPEEGNDGEGRRVIWLRLSLGV